MLSFTLTNTASLEPSSEAVLAEPRYIVTGASPAITSAEYTTFLPSGSLPPANTPVMELEALSIRALLFLLSSTTLTLPPTEVIFSMISVLVYISLKVTLATLTSAS